MSIAEHKAHVHQVLEALRTHKPYLNPKKCKLFRNRVPFLGHVISHNKLAMDPRKIEVVKNWGKLETKKDVQRFLGFTNFYRRFIHNFAKIAEPLTKILRKLPFNAKPVMTQEIEKAKDMLVSQITSDPILRMYDGKKELRVRFTVTSDHYRSLKQLS